ncbi:hypothetical protein CC86DRAFT_403757 [Ophiobolus disseminans]|uniref:RTA1-domain-containing protein n=1 Tax=Ophiobolus disseminans TaxID=1469910 RepID=A0A6A7A8R9_9PLEO|nr:hypothetical protein CC86DRAFT_403757 [Ophiobolus disseminans]
MSAPDFSHLNKSQSLYDYEPSLGAAIACAACCSAAVLFHMLLFVRSQAWCFWAFQAGILVEAVGFIVRAVSIAHIENEGAFMASYTFLLLGPSLMAVGCQTILIQIIWWATPLRCHRFRLLWCPIRFMNAISTGLGLAAFLVQLFGVALYYASFTTMEPIVDARKRGLAVLRVGAIFQLVILTVFAIVGMRFHIVSYGWIGRPVPLTRTSGATWYRLGRTISVASTLIIARTIFRLVEVFVSHDQPGYIVSNEWPFWAFDAIPMLVAVVLLAVNYPGLQMPTELLGAFWNQGKVQTKKKNIHSESMMTELEDV